MATSHTRRITRKELRQPDRFQLATEQALEYYQTHKNLVFAAIGALVLIGVIILAWQLFKERQNTAAAQEFANATELYQSEKYREALAALEKVQQYRWSHYAGLAYLYEANSQIALGELDKALSSAQRAVTASRPNTLYRQLALMALATAAEQKNDCRKAIESYNEAHKIAAAQQAEALLGKARCLEKSGDTAGALAAYKEYVKDQPGSLVSAKVAELESIKAVPPVAK
ncbi:MAG TPA: tetratricopeptide repeat protein [Candidatus Binatia bacterium]|nr:tetratricopeptide repeat protein [Candidatus Binatia bacterium]